MPRFVVLRLFRRKFIRFYIFRLCTQRTQDNQLNTDTMATFTTERLMERANHFILAPLTFEAKTKSKSHRKLFSDFFGHKIVLFFLSLSLSLRNRFEIVVLLVVFIRWSCVSSALSIVQCVCRSVYSYENRFDSRFIRAYSLWGCFETNGKYVKRFKSISSPWLSAAPHADPSRLIYWM